MGLRFTVLASGSGGNSSLVEADGFGVLLDVGLGPRQLANRLASAGTGWSAVHAALLTHTHGDHWKDRTFAHLQRRRAPLYCHPHHVPVLSHYSPAFIGLREAGLVRPYTPGEPLRLAPNLLCRPFPVRHDGGACCGFRLEGAGDLFGNAPSLAYAADLGCWDESVVAQLCDVDLLALEFNHDVLLERTSGRHPRLIARVLGDEGHLSNDQAALLLHAALVRSQAGRLRHVVQLHLSRDCNRPSMARHAAQAALTTAGTTAEVHTASQDEAGVPLSVGDPPARVPRKRSPRRVRAVEPWLPGLEAG